LDSFKDAAKLVDLPFDNQVDDVKVTKEGAGFDTPAGTRGSRRTSGPFGRWLGKWLDKLGGTRIGRKVFRKLMGCDALVLTTIGRKSGTERTTRVGCFPGKDGSWLIVAAAGGTAVNPAWYYNIAAHPDKVRIEVEGRKVAVTAEQLHGAERAEAWQQITAASPQFARFQQKTDRELPVIRLMLRSGSKAPHYYY
jgi:deazaflavin-dependent oxidoreductase (nitroreductase family)